MQPSYITPTPQQRCIAILKVITPLAAVYALALASRLYTNHVAIMSACSQLPWIRAIVIFATFILVAAAYLSFRSGLRVWTSGQSPAPGTSVLFKTRVHTGWLAKSSAIAMFCLAVIASVFLAAILKLFVFSEVGLFVAGLKHCGA